MREPSAPIWRAEGFEVDTREWPIVAVRYPKEPTPDGYLALFKHYAELAQRGDSIAWLVDMRDFNPVTAPASLRKGASLVFDEYRDVLTAATLCEARVMTSALARGVVTAFDWLTGNKWPCVNFANLDEARAWVEERCAKRT